MSNNPEPKKSGFIKIPQTKSTVLRNVILAFGLILIFAGILLAVYFTFNTSFPGFKMAVFPVLFLFSGGILIFLTFGLTKDPIILSIGIVLFLWGITALLSNTGLVPFTKKQLWPLIVVFSGIAVFISGLYHFKKIRSFYLFPSLTLVALGFLFLLFSMRIIKISLAKFIGAWWPFFVILVGLALVIIFFVKQKKSESFMYMEDDSSMEDGELEKEMSAELPEDAEGINFSRILDRPDSDGDGN